MKFTLIICTYNRPKPLLQLLLSVQEQTLYPNEILIIDGSENNETDNAETPYSERRHCQSWPDVHR